MTEMEDLYLNVASEFSDTPGPRSRDEGEFSGQEFLDNILRPRFEEALRNKTLLHINLDGTAGYATSFLEAAFGGLARQFPPETLLKVLTFTSRDEPYLIEEITEYIKEART